MGRPSEYTNRNSYTQCHLTLSLHGPQLKNDPITYTIAIESLRRVLQRNFIFMHLFFKLMMAKLQPLHDNSNSMPLTGMLMILFPINENHSGENSASHEKIN